MNSGMRRLLIGVALGVIAGAALMLGAMLFLPTAGLWPQSLLDDAGLAVATRESGEAPQTEEEAPQTEEIETAHAANHAVNAGSSRSAKPPPTEPKNSLNLGMERLQSIGVRFEAVQHRPIERTIRTVGRVEVDERRLWRINVKFEGWIDRLMVDYTGEAVRKGQVLFTLYSPELVATQQEYLLALQGRDRLGSSEYPEVADSSRALLTAARQRLRFWDIDESHIRDLERTGTILKTLPMHAPGTGTVISKTAVAGMQVKPGDELYTIADLSRLWLQADIFEYELPLVAVGQIASVSASYLPDASLQAVAKFIYPTVDTETRTAKVRFELDNPKGLLKPGMFMNLELKVPLGTRLVVPKDAVLDTGERQVIFIHLGGGRLEWRRVKPGVRGDDWLEMLGQFPP